MKYYDIELDNVGLLIIHICTLQRIVDPILNDFYNLRRISRKHSQILTTQCFGGVKIF
mgnify:CR=1 FL=1